MLFRNFQAKTPEQIRGVLVEEHFFPIAQKLYPVEWEKPGWFDSNGDLSLTTKDGTDYCEIKGKNPLFTGLDALTFQASHFPKCYNAKLFLFMSIYAEELLLFNILTGDNFPKFSEYEGGRGRNGEKVPMIKILPFMDDKNPYKGGTRPGVELLEIIEDPELVSLMNSTNTSRWKVQKRAKRDRNEW